MQVPEVAVLVALEELRAQDVAAAPEVRACPALGVRALCVLTAWGPKRWKEPLDVCDGARVGPAQPGNLRAVGGEGDESALEL